MAYFCTFIPPDCCFVSYYKCFCVLWQKYTFIDTIIHFQNNIMASIYKTLVLILMLCPLVFYGQMDTLLHEDFQDQALAPAPVTFPQGEDDTWVNFDADALPAANNRDGNWYWDYDQGQLAVSVATGDTIEPTDTNFVFGSSSWLEDLLPGNRNWLITPPIQIADDQATFHWKSAPFQGPRYMDGYSILVSTTDNFESSFTDTLYRAAQMITPLPEGATEPDVNAFNVDSFNFAPADAYVHADRYTLEDYYILEDSTDNLYIGILEPHSVSLAAYAGETIYLAILHDSDDDNLIFVDDLLLMGNDPSTSVEDRPVDNLRLITYPNPVDNFLNILYRLEVPAEVTLELYDMQGKAVQTVQQERRLTGEQSMRLNMLQLPSGTYNVLLTVDGQRYVRQVVKR